MCHVEGIQGLNARIDLVKDFSSSPKLATIKNQLLMCMVDDCVVGYMSDISTGLRYICYISHMWESREKATSSGSTHVPTDWTLVFIHFIILPQCATLVDNDSNA